MAARDDVQRVAGALRRPRNGYLKRVKADGTVIATGSAEAARQLDVFFDRVADLTADELRELYDETFGHGPLEGMRSLAMRLARHRTDAIEARLALDALTCVLDHLEADRNPFAYVVRALCCMLMVRVSTTRL